MAPFVFAVAYFVLFLRWKGATPGKLICGLRVRLRERPGRLPWSTIAIRVGVQSVLPWLASSPPSSAVRWPRPRSSTWPR